jgi:hypothetical protein
MSQAIGRPPVCRRYAPVIEIGHPQRQPGFGTVLKLLTGKSLEGHHVVDAANGFGSSLYGGTKK